jgi:hypothetical protein
MDWSIEANYWEQRYKKLRRATFISAIVCVLGGIAIGEKFSQSKEDACSHEQDKQTPISFKKAATVTP